MKPLIERPSGPVGTALLSGGLTPDMSVSWVASVAIILDRSQSCVR